MGYIIFLFLAVFVVYALTFAGKKAVMLLTILCFFQNIFLVVCSRFLDAPSFALIALIKEIYVVLYILIYVVKRKKIDNTTFGCFLCIMILLGCTFVYGRGEVKGMLASFRQLYLPFLFLAFGRCLELRKGDYIEISRFYIKCCLFAGMFGIVEMLIGSTFWNCMGLSIYANLKGLPDSRLRNGIFKSFYTYDFFGIALRRMASVLVDPVILGELLALGLVLSLFCTGLYKKKINKWLCIMFMAGCLLFTFAKGGYIIASISICVLIGQISKKRFLSAFLLTITIFIIIGFGFHSIENKLSGNSHINGLITGFDSLFQHPFGTGIGSAGNMADAYGGYIGNTVVGDESYMGSLMAQLGWGGIALNIWFWKRFFKKEYGRGRDADFIKVVNIVNIALLITSFINYTAISFTSCFMFVILGSICKNIKMFENNSLGLNR